LRASDRNEIMEKPNFSVQGLLYVPHHFLPPSTVDQSMPPRSRICGHASFM